MKKLLIILLCLVLVGCTVAEPQPTAPPSQKPTESTVPTEPVAPPPKDQTVKTDYSQYTPRQTLQPLYLPMETACEDLQPSEDYGAIYPYVGTTLASAYGGSHYVYGIMDEKGQLLTAPVYRNVQRLEYWDDYLGEERVILPFWTLTKTEVLDQGEYPVYHNRQALASLDGSWVTECRYTGISVSDDRILAMEKDWESDSFRFDFYDTEGRLLLTSEELEILSRIPNSISYAGYSDGMIRLDCYNYTKIDGNVWYTTGDGSTWYIDPEGSVLLGPYASGDNFSDGLAMVSDNYDSYYYIDKAGNPQFDRSFSGGESFKNGVALVNTGSRYQVIDTKGKVILDTMGYSSIYRDREYFVVTTDYINTYYDLQGQVVFEDIPFNWSYLGHGLFSDWAEEIIQVETQRRFTVSREPDAYHYAQSLWEQGIEALLVSDYTGSVTKSYLLDENAELIMEFEGGAFVLEDGQRSLLIINDGGSFKIYNGELEYLFSCPREAEPSVVCGDRLICFSEQYSLCYNLEGELIFCYPLPGFGGD